MTQSNNTPNRLSRLENDVIDLKLATSSLIETVNIHQRNFELMIAELQRDRTETKSQMNTILAEMQRDRSQVQARLDLQEQRFDLQEQQVNILGDFFQVIHQILQILTQRFSG